MNEKNSPRREGGLDRGEVKDDPTKKGLYRVDAWSNAESHVEVWVESRSIAGEWPSHAIEWPSQVIADDDIEEITWPPRELDNRGEGGIQKGEHFTDLGNARRLVRIHGGNIRIVAAFNSWFLWTGHRWQRDEDGAIIRLAKATIEKLFEESARIEDETIRAAARKHALRSQGASRLAAMVKLAETELPVVLSHKKLDADPRLLGIELDTATFRPGRRDDCISMQCCVAYDSKAACAEWIKFQSRQDRLRWSRPLGSIGYAPNSIALVPRRQLL